MENTLPNQQGTDVMDYGFTIYNSHEATLKEKRRVIKEPGHNGTIYELASPDGMVLGHYVIQSTQPGKVLFENARPFIQLTYTISGKKSYEVNSGSHRLLSFRKKEYNYLFFTNEQVQLTWQPGQKLEFFELGVSPELLLSYLPQEHPFYELLHRRIEKNEPAPMSNNNLYLQTESNSILYNMINCPLEGRYKQLYIKSKLIELLSIELNAFEQSLAITRGKAIKPGSLRTADVERMHQVREIIMSNLQSPCSLIDLAHQVGTNDAYLKKHFKEVFGATVFGYLHQVKMNQAKTLLLSGVSIPEVATLTGYKYASHFSRAFSKHFGIGPHKVKQ